MTKRNSARCSDIVAEFLSASGSDLCFAVTGGACAPILDSIDRHKGLQVLYTQHEQAAAMAADAVWRTSGKVGVSIATSGPGATNLLTGIACSYFDSIPSLHITGQASVPAHVGNGLQPRQRGFQETDIVAMAKPVTKYAVQVHSVAELRAELLKAYNIARSGRYGPVLIDIPVNLQFQAVDEELSAPFSFSPPSVPAADSETVTRIQEFLRHAERPLVIFGGGVGLAGVSTAVRSWLTGHRLPFVSSWAGKSFIDKADAGYLGCIGVYGARAANTAVQNADRILVLGSRLDNRQTAGHVSKFAPIARLLVIDIDGGELAKFAPYDRFELLERDMASVALALPQVKPLPLTMSWKLYLDNLQSTCDRLFETYLTGLTSLSPYQVLARISQRCSEDAVIISDTGATVCWTHQAFLKSAKQAFFTAGGHSPMGYALPAAIGARLAAPHRQVIAITGDGGMQLNIQELQVLRNLPVTIVIINNGCYGIIRQFQDSWLDSHYVGSVHGYSAPNFGAVARAYGIEYHRIESADDIRPELFQADRARILDVVIDPASEVYGKTEFGKAINEQTPEFPGVFEAINPYYLSRKVSASGEQS